MKFRTLHSWDLTPSQAIALQKELACKVTRRRASKSKLAFVAGVDVSYNRFSPRFYAAVVVLRITDCEIVEVQTAVRDTPFPYIPGLLSFREAPVLLEAFTKLRQKPDAVLVDGQGIAHPRRMGIASHLGLWLGIPTIGCAKSLLVGEFGTLAKAAGSTTPLVHKDEIVGQAVRTKTGVKPIYVSIGHKIDLASAVELTLRCSRGYRVPEPTRQAHLHVNALRRAELELNRESSDSVANGREF